MKSRLAGTPGRLVRVLVIAGIGLPTGLLAGCQRGGAPASAAPAGQAIADAVYAVLSADRETYAEQVVHRLQNEEKVIKASEHWKDEKLLPLPAQMFRMSAERVQKRGTGLTFALLSLWPINKQNAARTEVEREGLQAVNLRPDQPFGREELLGGKRYYTAVYPDKAVSQACVTCHNDHGESPRQDFKLGDVMGAVVIRIAQSQ